MSMFSAETYQNEFLPTGATEVDAVVTVSAWGTSKPVVATGAAEVLVLDTSGSMNGRKLRAAKQAATAAIDCLRDGVEFAVIAGTDEATVVYPERGLVPATERTRSDARRAVSGLEAGGGTAIGTWLTRANKLFEVQQTNVIRHAILLTDGKNEGETEGELEAALERCSGGFQCDCRGVGTDWDVEELRRVATALLGNVDIVAEPSDLEADFRSLMEHSMGRTTGNVSLRIWTPQGAQVAFVKQVSPTIEDLTPSALPHDALTADYGTGAWGEEERDYHVCITVPPHLAGDEMLAGRFSLVVDSAVVDQALIRALWTDDEMLSTRISEQVAHYTGQAELACAIQEGLEARKSGDVGTATVRLGHAVQLATESGHDATLQLLSQVVEIEDARTGTIRLRPQVDDADEMALDTRSTRSVRVGSTAS